LAQLSPACFYNTLGKLNARRKLEIKKGISKLKFGRDDQAFHFVSEAILRLIIS